MRWGGRCREINFRCAPALLSQENSNVRLPEFGGNEKDKRLRSQISRVIYGEAQTTDGRG